MTRFSDTGTFPTRNASKYLQQLCKHFGHKIDVRFDEHQGHAELPLGPADFEALDNELRITVTGEEPQAVDKARQVIDSHLVRFAFREGFEKMAWQGERPV